ncbi:hypothetical protein GC173_10585 [bacterium]|nr:hypothetical protein [bacterium]
MDTGRAPDNGEEPQSREAEESPDCFLVLANLPLVLIGCIADIYFVETPTLLANTGALLGIGGFITSTFLNAIVVPVGYAMMFGKQT